MKKYFLLVALIQPACYCLAQPINSNQVKAFDAYVDKARKEWNVPGLAIAVVKDGKVLLNKGYGVTELGTNKEVNAETLFACASTTKAMTATCMGMLVDEGKVNWNDRVIEYLPEFQLHDPFVTRELRILDLFTHNSGVGNADFLWVAMDITGDEILQRMRMVEPSYSMRLSFIYQNIFYLAAGKVIEKVSGQPWNEFIQERIFDPLKMTRTYPTLGQIKDSNQTKPHFNIDGKMTVIVHTSADRIGPAGSVWSCTDDMTKWMMCMIDSGKYEGGRLVKPSTWTMMTKPHVMVTASQFYPTQQLTKPNWTTYGMGWFQHDYKGRKINFHTGSLAGAIAIHGQIPEDWLGVYVFGNFDHAEVRHALMYKAFDLFALGGTRDWSAEFHQLYSGLQADSEKREKEFESKRVADTQPSLDLTQYAGEYADLLYGNLTVTLNGSQLEININEMMKATVSHWHHDTFYGPYARKWYGKALVQFELDALGKVKNVTFDGMKFTRK
jgi:CubicO group peptidase (beta-lactamase class C family)